MHLCPRIRLTKTHKKGRAIIPIESISGIDEDLKEKCTRISTFDGFWYEVTNTIEDVDKKIEDAEKSAMLLTCEDNPDGSCRITPLVLSAGINKPTKKPVRKMLPPGVDKPPRRVAEISKTESKPPPIFKETV